MNDNPDRIVGFGELLLRLSPSGRRLIVQAQSLDIEVGGAEANVLAGLSALGHQCAMVSAVADNPLGRLALATLGARGIDTHFVASSAGRMGLYFLEQGQGLRASAISYDRAGSVFAMARPDDFDFDTALRGARLLHLSGITPALGSDSARLALAAARIANDLGVTVSFDGNFRAQLWSAWDSDPKTILTELIGMADILFGNHRDISLLTGREFSGEGSQRRREAVEAAFGMFPRLKLVASTARHIVNADHHQISARVDNRSDATQTATIDVTGIIDRIGTGDAFAAGVLHRYLQGAAVGEMAEAGLGLAALKHSLPADMPIFNEDELNAYLSGGSDVRR